MKNLFIAFLLLINSFSFGQILSEQSTLMGGNFQGLNAEEESYACNTLMKCKYIRDQITISTFNGSNDGIDIKHEAGLKILVNLNWEGGGSTNDHRLFAGNETAYKNGLREVLDVYADMIEVAVIENEPTNGRYFNFIGEGTPDDPNQPPYTTIADYLDMLEWAVDVCHEYNVKVSDGATHLEYYEEIMDPPINNSAAQRAADIIFGIRDRGINVDFVNFHFKTPSTYLENGSVMEPGRIKVIVDFMQETSGADVITNEWHLEPGTPNEESLITSIVTEMRKAHVRYNLVFGGHGESDALVLVEPNGPVVLTSLGAAYRDAINSFD